MSLDVYISGDAPDMKEDSAIFIRRDGAQKEITRAEWVSAYPNREPFVVLRQDGDGYSDNITHNLTKMASEAGIYEALWRPEEIGITTANQLIEPLQRGLDLLLSDPDRFRSFNPDNRWGDYEGLVKFVQDYLDACRRLPRGGISVSR